MIYYIWQAIKEDSKFLNFESIDVIVTVILNLLKNHYDG